MKRKTKRVPEDEITVYQWCLKYREAVALVAIVVFALFCIIYNNWGMLIPWFKYLMFGG